LAARNLLRVFCLAKNVFAAVYWVTQAGAILYPGTAVVDSDSVTPVSMIMGVPGQIYAEVFFLVLTGLA
jgi:hypothetical protein